MHVLEAGSYPMGGLDCWVFPCPRQWRKVLLEAALIWPGGWPGWDQRGQFGPTFAFRWLCINKPSEMLPASHHVSGSLIW